MPYEPLHHKYRPQTFAELVGQQAIATTLSNALRQQRIAPAYLFTGARGTGKTSSARILAKSLNCLKSDTPTAQPCGVCEVCRAIANGSALDVIEIDAASNTGVDNIRELIERAHFAPVQCRYKVYCIDECHMLSTAAFNALLKTLEEPPARVIFVLATTDPQKVLPTIISRCQRFDFRRIPLADMVEHLGAIAAKESISITSEAIQLIAQIAQGGLRDAESLLDQLSLLEGEITAERVWDLVGAVPERDLFELVQAIAQDIPAMVLDKVRHLMDRGREPLIVLQNLASFYRDLLIAKTAPERTDLVAITPSTWTGLCEFVQGFDMAWIMAGQQHLRASEVQVKNTSQPRLWLEVTLMGLLPGVRSQESGVRSQQSAVSNQESAISNQQSAISSQQLAVSNQESAVSSQQSAVSNQESAVSSQELGSGSREVGVGRQGLGNGAEGLAPLTAGDGELASSDGGVGHPLEQVFEPVVPGATPAKFEVAASGSPDLESGGQEQIELKQIWQQVIEYLHPLSKGLLRDHGRLAGLSEQQAQIEITAPKLLKIAQSKISDIEKSFAKVVNRPVKVNLTIAITPRVESETPQPSADLALGGADGASVTTAMMANDYPVPHSSQSPSGVSQSQVASEQQFSVKMPTQSDVSLPSQRSQTAADTQELSSNPNPLDYQVPQKKWQEEDEVTRAAKSIAQMFNGQIVNLADDLESPLDSEGSVASRDSFNLTEGELADDDVPF